MLKLIVVSTLVFGSVWFGAWAFYFLWGTWQWLPAMFTAGVGFVAGLTLLEV